MKLKRGTAARPLKDRKEWSKKVHASMTPEQRSERARNAAKIKWEKKKET